MIERIGRESGIGEIGNVLRIEIDAACRGHDVVKRSRVEVIAPISCLPIESIRRQGCICQVRDLLDIKTEAIGRSSYVV